MIKVQHIALAVYLLLCPIAYKISHTGMLREFQEAFWQIYSMGFLVLFVGNIWVSLFFIWAVALYCINGDGVGSQYLINMFVGIMLFMASKTHFRRFVLRTEMKALYWVAGLTCVWMIMQYLQFDPLYVLADGAGNRTDNVSDLVGLFGLKAANAGFFALIAPLVAHVCAPVAVLFIIPIWLGQSSGAILAFAVAMLFYFFFTWRKLVYVLVPVAMIVGTIYFMGDRKADPFMFTSRLGIWHAGVKKALARPIGYGPDSWRNLNKYKNFMFMGDEWRRPAIAYHIKDGTYNFVYYGVNPQKQKAVESIILKNPNIWDNAHNLYVQILFEFGVVGLVILGFFVRDMVLRFRAMKVKSKELVAVTACLIGFAVLSITQFPLYLARLGFLFPIVLGCFYAITEREGIRR